MQRWACAFIFLSRYRCLSFLKRACCASCYIWRNYQTSCYSKDDELIDHTLRTLSMSSRVGRYIINVQQGGSVHYQCPAGWVSVRLFTKFEMLLTVLLDSLGCIFEITGLKSKKKVERFPELHKFITHIFKY